VLRMAVGHSDELDPADAAAEVVAACRASLDGLEPAGAILFASFDSFSPALVAGIRGGFPDTPLLGSTSAAEMSSVGGYREDSVVLAALASDRIDMAVGVADGLDGDVEIAVGSAVRQALDGSDREPRLCIVLADFFAADGQRMLDAVADSLPPGVVVVGGVSAREDFRLQPPSYQVANDRIVADGIAVMVLSGEFAFSTGVRTGLRPLGGQGTVTRSEFGQLLEIDGRPAREFTSRYLDVTGPATFGNPLAVFEPGAEDFYLRAIQAADEPGALSVPGLVPLGSRVQLTTSPTEDLLAGATSSLDAAAATFPGGATVEAALIFSCAVRRFLLGTKTRREAEIAQLALGADLPLAGVYCFGEVGPIAGTPTSRYLNDTFVTLLLGT
jgi:hypothetical protein